MAVSLAACSASGEMKTTPATSLTPLGRYHQTDDGMKMGWPGSGYDLNFKGKSLSVYVTDDGQGIMDVFIDEVEAEPISLMSGRNSYVLVSSNRAESLSVRVTRRTEVFDTGLFTIHGFTHDGILRSAPTPSRKILFLGDSITAGFGVRGPNAQCPYAPDTNAPWQTYAALTAKAFGAEPHFIAISGRGVVYNWDNNPAPLMPAQLDMTLPDTPEVGAWGHRDWRADAVVIALGTNDWSTVPRGEDWPQGYEALLTQVRDHYPRAPIFVVDGPLLTPERNMLAVRGIEEAMDVRAAMGDENIHRVSLTLAPSGEQFSCNYHPSAASNAHMAQQLIQVMGPTMGWNERN